MNTWIRRPQEQEGTYLFSGTFYITRGIESRLSTDEIIAIYAEIQALAMQNGGLDYLQVYENGAGEKLYFIDQCNKEMMTSGSFDKEDNYCTLLLASEY